MLARVVQQVLLLQFNPKEKTHHDMYALMQVDKEGKRDSNHSTSAYNTDSEEKTTATREILSLWQLFAINRLKLKLCERLSNKYTNRNSVAVLNLVFLPMQTTVSLYLIPTEETMCDHVTCTATVTYCYVCVANWVLQILILK